MKQQSLSAVIPKKIRAKFTSRPLSTGGAIACYTIAILILAGVGVLFQNATIGNLMILAFGIIAVVVYVRGVEVLRMMLVTLVCSMILTGTKNYKLANVFAQYAFLFLIIAMVNLMREEWGLIRKTVDK